MSPSGTARHILKLLKNGDVLVVLPRLVAEFDALLHLSERVLEHFGKVTRDLVYSLLQLCYLLVLRCYHLVPLLHLSLVQYLFLLDLFSLRGDLFVLLGNLGEVFLLETLVALGHLLDDLLSGGLDRVDLLQRLDLV